ncbi:Uncharacterized protein conserved in bacteria [Enterobacter hormaechei]|uniref:DUF2000 domain-containing protein n=1 Tax=Enterobacter hormaechei TaxID=158836 RepID=UPI000796873C|nr:DUF2000 domain-containing protein [Enterobacter hormaechei]CAG0337980.1 hypothetical protein AN2364V1_1114 [Enterobacter cloacae]MBJ6479240.1 DUF2000 domain-containing protein [Enterobacter hormaechei]MBJ6503551.1 DUF2000 domain-containing protein [Enterobacter hormaechei]MBJ6546444.1 DUF2000 domain-containing protein [Enterobacter hormaechei]MBJ6552345.1 DUF2000 domain-containing protein [Enterobacter hormaechei]
MFEDNQKKLYIVVNRMMEPALLLNATAHLAAGIMRKADDALFHDYSNEESGLQAYLSHYPVVILQAKNSNQLKTALLKCQGADITFNYFSTRMLGASSEAQIQATKETSLESLEFIAIALYGDTERMLPVTKKFSVFKMV